MSIIQHFNQGWQNLKAAALEQDIVRQYCRAVASDRSNTVLVNNTWYYTNFGPNGEFEGTGSKFHESVVEFLKSNDVDRVVVYSLVDPAWNDPDYTSLGINTVKIGYYPGNNWIDFHAIVFDKFSKKEQICNNNITVPFMCLNGKPHPHREQLVKKLVELNLHDEGIVSYSGSKNCPALVLPETHQKMSDVNSDPYDAMTLGDMQRWNSHFLNVVTETIWDVENFCFWSEKIFKPIVGQRPFLVYTPNGAVDMLKQHKFEAFVNDFGDISELDLLNPENIPEFLKVLSSQTISYYYKKYQELTPKIEYNYNRFFEHVVEQRRKIDHGIDL